ncbi:protein of unknown function [Halobacillus karajensis]|uniref:DUF4349 domain-containing protein n=1 Tax=Halobacillus karajensis TaxID=195088 RepID=A0A024P7G1_9BACI|nr:DUF4349 domain-containing protein [Halobacillus karajensis]CDQ21056.1 hypothetical protein BN982_03419 [Halobacillus karajensis]CDQ24880.1 hypothetical protein BN983_03179 [Halobacillus karajensis]CDQ28760.1 hypothetical protein BN981_03075 [Halobacillus karajensis]SEH96836.1 protein of unknown function [Halobacillus karajensis]
MENKRKRIFLLFIFILVFTACSNNNDGEESSNEAEFETLKDSSDEAGPSETSEKGLSETAASAETEEQAQNQKEQMIIYEAHIDLETKDFNQFEKSLKEQMNEMDAYMVETNIQKSDHGNRQGHLRIRVPQPNFETFLNAVENISGHIQSRNINNRDVTKNYVDLESRLKAKEEIEARLLSFLDRAEATEDLVRISQDLERVQSDIESLKGEMNYLENQSDFSTITISFTETKVMVGGVDQQNLDTWDRTKQAFVSSVNGIVTFASWLFITTIGYSPFLIPLLLIAWLWWWRKAKKQDT